MVLIDKKKCQFFAIGIDFQSVKIIVEKAKKT